MGLFYNARRATLIALSILIVTIVSAQGAFGASETLPFKDPNARGFIGFCDKNRRPITSGSLYDQPFVWTAVSSSPAPKGYEKGSAVLIAFQPREGVEPGLWSARQLHAPSTFTNPKHPMSQAVNIDDPLLFFVQAFPPKWDGLVQLRIYFAARNVGQYVQTYPATTIRVAGNRWAVVRGGTIPCNVGKATSIATEALPASRLASPPPLRVAGNPLASSSTNAEGVAQGNSGAGGGGLDVTTAGLIGVGLLGSGLGGLFLLRRRSGAGT